MSKLLTERVVNILNHPALAPIGFEMFGLVVTGTRYSVVRQAIQSGKITCTRTWNMPAPTRAATRTRSGRLGCG